MIKLSIIILSLIAVATGFTSIIYTKSVYAFSIDVGDIHMNFDNLPSSSGTQGPPGPKGDKGDTGAQGPQGEQGPKGDPGDPCPHQSTLSEPAIQNAGEGSNHFGGINGKDIVVPDSPHTPGDNNVCVP